MTVNEAVIAYRETNERLTKACAALDEARAVVEAVTLEAETAAIARHKSGSALNTAITGGQHADPYSRGIPFRTS